MKKRSIIAIVVVLGITLGLIFVSKKAPESVSDKTRPDETEVLELSTRDERDNEVEALKAVPVEIEPEISGRLSDFVLRLSQLRGEFSGAKLQEEQIKLIHQASTDLTSKEMQEFVQTLLAQVSETVIHLTSAGVIGCILRADFEVYEQWFRDLGESDLEVFYAGYAVGNRIRLGGDTELASRILSLLSGKKREEGILRYAGSLAGVDGNRAIQFLEDHGQLHKHHILEIGPFINSVSPDTDFEALIQKTAMAKQVPKETWEEMVLKRWAFSRQAEAWDWIQENRNEAERPRLIAAAVNSWYRADFTGLATFLDQQPKGVDRDVASIQFAKLAVSRDREAAIEWLKSVRSKSHQTEAEKLIKEFLAE